MSTVMKSLNEITSPSTANFNAMGASTIRRTTRSKKRNDMKVMHLVQQSPFLQTKGKMWLTICLVVTLDFLTSLSGSLSRKRWVTRLMEDERNSLISIGISEPRLSNGSCIPCSKLISERGRTFCWRTLILDTVLFLYQYLIFTIRNLFPLSDPSLF